LLVEAALDSSNSIFGRLFRHPLRALPSRGKGPLCNGFDAMITKQSFSDRAYPIRYSETKHAEVAKRTFYSPLRSAFVSDSEIKPISC